MENQILPYPEGEKGRRGSEVRFKQLAIHLSEYDDKQRGNCILRYSVIYTSSIVVYGTTTYGRDSGDK